MVDSVEYTKRFIYLSNQWYNDGLKKANIRDLSGAITSLKTSLQFNRDNIAARNLLGLVYYGRGEVVEALVEWIISKNIKSHGNIATYYIKKVQESPSELEVINQAIKKYNQCLVYCQQGGEDLAVIQLRKVVSAHPNFLKAHQLLALIYMQTEQYAKARQVIRKAHKLDTTNETTLRYMHELKQLRSSKVERLKDEKEKEQAVSYKLGNEVIIQPLSTTLKDNATMLTILNIVIGLVVGAAVVWFLVFPTLKQSMASEMNQEIITYSEQIAAKKTEIDLLNRELEQYKAESETTAQEKEIAQATQTSYEALVAIIQHYYQADYDKTKLVEELLSVKTESLGDIGKTVYETIKQEVFTKQCAEIYATAKQKYEAGAIKTAAEQLEQIMKMDEKYDDGKAMLLLFNAYHANSDIENRQRVYERIQELFPETEVANSAASVMTPVAQ